MIGAVLLHGDGPLEGTIAHAECDSVSSGFLDDFAGLVTAVACNHLSIDLRWEGGGGRRDRERERERQRGRRKRREIGRERENEKERGRGKGRRKQRAWGERERGVKERRKGKGISTTHTSPCTHNRKLQYSW